MGRWHESGRGSGVSPQPTGTKHAERNETYITAWMGVSGVHRVLRNAGFVIRMNPS